MVSFDIYDTLITRVATEPKDIFLYMKEEMRNERQYDGLPQYIIDDFPRIRECAENIARTQKKGEVTLEDIYTVLIDNYNINSYLAKMIYKLEMEVELKFSIPIIENIELVKKTLSEGVKVILITDMYMEREFFHRLFNQICPLLNDLPLYISGEEKVSKASGKLYEFIRNRESVSYEDWKHIGDNFVSDYSIPKLLGINAELYEGAKCDIHYDRLQTISFGRSIVQTKILMGLQKQSKFKFKNNAYKIGYTFVSIPLYSYVDWVIKQAIGRGIKGLYFIARDGYILKQIADIIIENQSLCIKTCYLYGSRKAWRTEDADKIQILKKYLCQEITEKENEYALIDTQGTGLSIDYLSRIVGHEIIIFYYSLIEDSVDKAIRPIVYSSYPGGDMIEVFCRAPHGSTQGYKYQNDKIIPILSEVSEEVYENNEFKEYVEGIVDFAKDYEYYKTKLESTNSLETLGDLVINYCVSRPDRVLANFIGDIPHDTNNKNEQTLYAPLLNKKDIKRIEYDRRTEYIEEVYDGANLLYSYNRLDDETKELVEEYKSKYYSQKIEKEDNPIHVIIYGYGVYGQELLHRLFGSKKVVVDTIVDANYRKYSDAYVKVESLERLKKQDYDYVVISLYNKRIALEVEELLIAAGIREELIIQRKDLLEKYI